MTYNQLTKDDINERLKNKCIEALDDYKDTKSTCTFKCLICGETFSNKYDNVRYWKGEGCPKCKGTISSLLYSLDERIKKKERKITNNINPYLQYISFIDDKLEYVNVKCLICNTIYTMAYSSVVRGSGHKDCMFKLLGKDRLLPIQVVKQKIIEYGNNFEVDFSNYNSADSKLDCFCNVCGNHWKSKSKNIIRGRGCPACARIRRNNSKKKGISEYEGLLEKFNLEIIGEYDCASKPFKVRCKKCGEYFNTSISYLREHEVGCVNCNMLERRNKKFLEFLSKINNKHIHVIGNFTYMSEPLLFYCDECNKTFFKEPHEFLKSQVCPKCIVNSKLEYLISSYLNDHNITYEPHISFDDLRGVNNGLLSYDFYLPHYNLLIEAQGEQHVRPIEHFGGEKQFKIQQEHDKRKREYAGNNNFSLLEIWYNEEDNLTNILNQKLNLNNNQELAFC